MKPSVFLLLYLLIMFPPSSAADIAFIANVDGNWDLFTFDERIGSFTRLTETEYDEKNPAWSPDRKSIVYLTSDGQLNVINVENKKTSEITAGDGKLRKYSPVFSPDGKKIIYAQARPGANDDSDLMIYDLESAADSMVLDQHSIQMWPTPSPDGKKLVYSSLHCNESCGRFIQELWLFSSFGQRAKQLLLTNSFCKQAVYSPDGRSIAFASDMKGNFDIWTLSLDDMKLEQLTSDQGMDESPAWSPDGKKIAFISNSSGIPEIWVKDIGSEGITKIEPFKGKKVACRDVAW